MNEPDDGSDPVDHLRSVLGNDVFNKFLWIASFDGSMNLVLSTVREPLPVDEFNDVMDALKACPTVASVQLMYQEPDDLVGLEKAEDRMAGYDSSWYWPTSERLPRSSYTAPAPIRIAQADSGVSMQPCLIGGFDPAKSMSFFFPPGQREGKGVICWDHGAPYFIGHGTSTAGLVIGQPADGMKLYGMTVRDVVDLVPCRVADSVLLAPPDLKRLAECIDWAVGEGIKVITISLGAIAAPQDPALITLTKAVENAFKKGVIICAAAGQIAPGMIWPGVYSLKGWLIACGPSKADNLPSAQSIWPGFQDGYVTIAAPGENMPRTGWKDDRCATNIPELGVSEGSSYSTAYTASVAALWWAYNYDALSNMDPRQIVPLFRNTLQKTCTPWNGKYNTSKFGPGIVDPNKAISSMKAPQDLKIDSSGSGHVERVSGGTYRNLTLHAHGSGSIHVIDPVFVEGKLTLISEASAAINMSGTIICKELEIKVKNSGRINADDLEYYDKCHVDILHAGVLEAYIAAEGPMSGSVKGPEFFNGSTLRAWIHWRSGRKKVSISKDWMSTVDISNNWPGRWA
ncbi:S8 family serine peptidase [Sulfitobacter sp. AS59]|uniref:S8 family serine peptidase n=1 Tax=Sulfitobacter sp. AS59 TaxID=3135784 RepID=UPI003182489C